MNDLEQHVKFAKSRGYSLKPTILINNLDFIHNDGQYISPISIKELLENFLKEEMIYWDYDEKEYFYTAKDVCEFYYDDYGEFCLENGLQIL